MRLEKHATGKHAAIVERNMKRIESEYRAWHNIETKGKGSSRRAFNMNESQLAKKIHKLFEPKEQKDK